MCRWEPAPAVGLCSCCCGQRVWDTAALLPGISITQVRVGRTTASSSHMLNGGSATREREAAEDLSPASSDQHLWVFPALLSAGRETGKVAGQGWLGHTGAGRLGTGSTRRGLPGGLVRRQPPR